MSLKRRPGIVPRWTPILSLLIATSVAADEGYRFFYNFAPGSSFSVTERSQQVSGGKLIARFRKTVEFQVSQARGSLTPTITAQITSLSNLGRRIDYYDEVTFKANISATGEISNYSFSGGLPKHSQLIQAVGPANRTNIFWMPRFPDTPLRIGDSFFHSVSIEGAEAETIYELEEVEGHLARFRLRQTGSLVGGSVGGTQMSEGRAVFDLEQGMWSSLDLHSEGTARGPGGSGGPYKVSLHKEISRVSGAPKSTRAESSSPKTQPTPDPCQALRHQIGQRHRELDQLIDREAELAREIQSTEQEIRDFSRPLEETGIAPGSPEEWRRYTQQALIENARQRRRQSQRELQAISERRRQLKEEVERLRGEFRQQQCPGPVP